MKTLGKWISLILLLFASSMLFLPESCFLCSRLSCHEPCLVDMKSGYVLPLTLYMPHSRLVGQLAENPMLPNSFSFLSCGGAQGTRDTGIPSITMDIPAGKSVLLSGLCPSCRKKLPSRFSGQYLLADLYNRENPVLYNACEEICFDLRCYHITIEKRGECFQLTVLGTLKG